MASTMTPSPMTNEQIERAVEIFRAQLRKHAAEFPSDAVQQAFGQPELGREWLAVLRKRVEAIDSVEEQLVDYDAYRMIERDAYAYVGDVTIRDYPETETGTKLVRFRELEFDHNPTDDEVLAKAKQENCRQPSRAEAETRIHRYTPEQLREHPRVGLIGPAVSRDGGLCRACVNGFEGGVRLGWDWARGPWGRLCRFVVVEIPLGTRNFEKVP